MASSSVDPRKKFREDLDKVHDKMAQKLLQKPEFMPGIHQYLILRIEECNRKLQIANKSGEYTSELAMSFVNKIYVEVAKFGGCDVNKVTFSEEVLINLMELVNQREILIDKYVLDQVAEADRKTTYDEITKRMDEWLFEKFIDMKNKSH